MRLHYDLDASEMFKTLYASDFDVIGSKGFG